MYLRRSGSGIAADVTIEKYPSCDRDNAVIGGSSAASADDACKRTAIGPAVPVKGGFGDLMPGVGKSPVMEKYTGNLLRSWESWLYVGDVSRNVSAAVGHVAGSGDFSSRRFLVPEYRNL